jgi:DNA ligase (NAD+)
MAYKFKSEQVSTKLNSISYQIGRTGAIDPSGKFRTSTIRNYSTSLHNADQIEN